MVKLLEKNLNLKGFAVLEIFEKGQLNCNFAEYELLQRRYHKKMKFSIKDFFSWSHLLKKSLMENFILAVVWGLYILSYFLRKKFLKILI